MDDKPPSNAPLDKWIHHISHKFSSAETPLLVVDLNQIRIRYSELQKNLSGVNIFYAVKSNPARDVLALLAELGASFDIASIYELDKVLELNVDPSRISYGNTIKKPAHIKYAYEKGIRLFATDSDEDLKKIEANAPGSKVFFRIQTDGSGADWPLSKKFGAHPDHIFSLIMLSTTMNVIPYGISFHVGSQQRDIGSWDNAIATCRYLFSAAKEKGVSLKLINLGGGLPADYMSPTLDIGTYCSEIMRFIREDFPTENLDLIIEPGRGLVGDSGVLITEVVLCSKKNKRDFTKWVYLDTGVFNGLIETLNESIKYPIAVIRNEKAIFGVTGETMDRTHEEVILAGPTCDSMDIMYQDHKYRFPGGLKTGERIYFATTGAYTSSYCAVEFNGFPPLKTVFIDTKNEL